MKAAVTVSLVPQAKGGPFVFWDGLENACAEASALGFHAIEIFPPDAEAVAMEKVKPLLQEYGLELAAVGTGGGWVAHKLTFTHAEVGVRIRAREFARAIVHAAGALGAPAIIGSMQGKMEREVSRENALAWLKEALEDLASAAAEHGQVLIYEPLNRYETNLFNRLRDTADFLSTLATPNVRILADLFHMNIEEPSLPQALADAGEWLGHVHFADSRRWAMGFGHTDAGPVVEQLRTMNYTGYLSAEVLPLPSSTQAAEQTMAAFRKYVG